VAGGRYGGVGWGGVRVGENGGLVVWNGRDPTDQYENKQEAHLEHEAEPKHQRLRRQVVLLAPNHEAAGGQVLTGGSGFGDLRVGGCVAREGVWSRGVCACVQCVG